MNQIDVDQAFAALVLPAVGVIDGVPALPRAGAQFEVINPANGERIASVSEFDAADVDRAVVAARYAFEHGAWRRDAPAARKAVLHRFADLVLRSRLELAALETWETGKPITHALEDVDRAAETLRWYAEAADKRYDELAPMRSDRVGMITREPIGVVAAISAWNFPLAIAKLKLAPALASGNSVILKPSELSSLCSLRLVWLGQEAGVPPGVLSVLTGRGPVTGQALAEHMDVDCVSFTGSGPTGRRLLETAARTNLKRVWLELGGKTPNIVLDDAANLPYVASESAEAIFYNQGQVCSASSRLIVTPGVRDELVAAVLAAAEALRPGDPRRLETQLGAVVSRSQLNRILDYVRIGQDEGARLRVGGHCDPGLSAGCFMLPTVFDRVDNAMRIAREEVFGPVLSIIDAKDTDDAVRIANDSPYGLAASVWTSQLSTAHRVAKALRAGRVGVNCCEGGGLGMPWGGFKQSGSGREHTFMGMDQFTEVKSTWMVV